MKKIATWTVLALATTLAGCAGAANSNRSLESVHQPVVRNDIDLKDTTTFAAGWNTKYENDDVILNLDETITKE